MRPPADLYGGTSSKKVRSALTYQTSAQDSRKAAAVSPTVPCWSMCTFSEYILDHLWNIRLPWSGNKGILLCPSMLHSYLGWRSGVLEVWHAKICLKQKKLNHAKKKYKNISTSTRESLLSLLISSYLYSKSSLGKLFSLMWAFSTQGLPSLSPKPDGPLFLKKLHRICIFLAFRDCETTDFQLISHSRILKRFKNDFPRSIQASANRRQCSATLVDGEPPANAQTFSAPWLRTASHGFEKPKLQGEMPCWRSWSGLEYVYFFQFSKSWQKLYFQNDKLFKIFTKNV